MERENVQHLREQDLESRVAVVTGASKGIGKAIAINLASRGCSIIATCSTTESLRLIDTIAKDIIAFYNATEGSKQAPKVIGIIADIFSAECHATIADAVETHFGHLDIIVLNAGATGGGKVGALKSENVQGMCLGNIQAPIMTVEELVRRKFFRKESRIMFISSAKAKMGNAGAPLYAATKSAMESIIRTWADAFGGKDPNFGFMAGTTANSVQVGLTRTEAVNRHGPEALQKLEHKLLPQMSVPRLGEADDVADVVGLLVRREASWITGSVVAADGGTVKIC